MSISGFSPGAHSLVYSNGTGDWLSTSITADANGNGSKNNDAYYGYCNIIMWVSVDGVEVQRLGRLLTERNNCMTTMTADQATWFAGTFDQLVEQRRAGRARQAARRSGWR